MINNIQKSFKRKSELRAMADGGTVRPTPEMLGTGMAQRAGTALQGRRAQLDAEIDAASGAPPASPAPTPVTAAPVKEPEGKSALRSFFGLADGGQVFKNTIGGVPTYTDARAATAGATAHTPGQGGGTFSVIGMEPAQKQQMAAAPTTVGAPSSTPTIGSELDAAIGRTQGVTSAQTPATGAPANGAGRTMDPQKTQTFSGMSQAAATDAAQMRDIGVQAGEAAAAAARPASPLQFSSFDEPSSELEFADGGDVEGKGGPTDDRVGPVMLSDGEYVLPADTVDIVGRDKLDALRLATHDFVDDGNKPKVSSLRKMANGGTFYVDPEGVASRRLPSRELVPYQQPTAGSPGGGGRGPVPHQPTAGSPGGVGRGAGALRGLGVVGGIAASAPAVNASVGEWARGIPEVLRGESAPQPNTKVRFLDGQPTPEPVFNPTPAELDRRRALRPESVDAAMGNLRSGNAPGGGFQQISGTDVYRRNNPNAGNPGESAHQYIGVGTPERQTEDPIMGELRSALRGLGTQQSSGGGSTAFSRKAMADINKRYDDLLRSGAGQNRVRGLDWSQRHGLDLERARASELGEFARNQSALRGQDMSASTAANSAANQARMQALQTLGSLANQRAQQAASGGTAALRAMNDAARLEGQGEDRLDQRANRAVNELTSFATRQYGEDSPEGRDFEMAFRATNPDFMTMPDGDRASLLAQFREQWDAQGPVRARAAALGRPIGVGQAPVMSGDPVSVGIGDWANDRATFGDWMESFNLIGPNDATARVVPDGSGGINMLVSEKALTTRKDGSKRADVISRLRTGDK